MLVIFPGFIVALGTAQTSALTAVAAPNSALSWMDIKDTSGVQLSSYLFATNRGGVFNPGNTVLSLLISVLFAIWLVLVTTGVWLPSQTFDFGWLNMFSAPLRGVATNLTAQIATPLMMATAAAIGAFFVGWFIVRGYHAKAVMQVLTMVVAAILGPLFLAAPLAEVLSSDGLLVQGRDLGISVAAGLNGNNNPNPSQTMAQMQADMATNFGRYPLQVWNFNHIVDNQPSCKAAWTAGVMAGDEDRVKDGMKSCGDSAAYSAANNPSVGQIGAGILLLFSAGMLLLFGAYLSVKVVWAALDTIYYGFAAIFGFAAGAFVYGVTQTFTVRSVVHGFVAAARMAIFIMFLGIYELFLGSLFQQARGQVMAVFVIGALVEIVAILQARRLSRGLDSSNDWISNRFAMAIQSGNAKSSGGGGTALGMGQASSRNAMSGLAMFAAASTISGSPITAWATGGIRDALMPNAFAKSRADKLGWAIAGEFGEEMQNIHYDRRALGEFAERGSGRAVRIHGAQPRGQLAAAFAAEQAMASGGAPTSTYAALRKSGFGHNIALRASSVQSDITELLKADPLPSEHLARVVAASRLFEQDYEHPGWSGPKLDGLRAAAYKFRRNNPGGVNLPRGLVEEGERFLANPTQQYIHTLQKIAQGGDPGASTWMHRDGVRPFSKRDAERLEKWITNESALRVQAATDWVADNPTDFQRIRRLREEINVASDINNWQNGKASTGQTAVAPPHVSDTRPLAEIPADFIRAAQERRMT
ncbi:hypothetical protein AB0B25_28810 [Nocardia sp. NPDC049190]|uniref:hypothetical protein n=1 Tax=Nocardia sp. NPDC049190 TaxID=3155650 RepID=UPI003405FF5A